MITISTVEKIGHHKPAFALAMRFSAEMMERGLINWGPEWSRPAVIAMDDNICAGFVIYDPDPDCDFLDIELVGVNPAYRTGARVLIPMLARARDIAKNLKKRTIRFVYHPDNPYMKDAARIFQGRVRSMTVEIKTEDLV